MALDLAALHSASFTHAFCCAASVADCQLMFGKEGRPRQCGVIALRRRQPLPAPTPEMPPTLPTTAALTDAARAGDAAPFDALAPADLATAAARLDDDGR